MFSPESVIRASGLTKKYGGFTAVNHIDFWIVAVTRFFFVLSRDLMKKRLIN